MTDGMTEAYKEQDYRVPENCKSCGKPLLLRNLFVDDGCPCNSPRGVNFVPLPCDLCKTDNCVKPGHHLTSWWHPMSYNEARQLLGMEPIPVGPDGRALHTDA